MQFLNPLFIHLNLMNIHYISKISKIPARFVQKRLQKKNVENISESKNSNVSPEFELNSQFLRLS